MQELLLYYFGSILINYLLLLWFKPNDKSLAKLIFGYSFIPTFGTLLTIIMIVSFVVLIIISIYGCIAKHFPDWMKLW